MIMKKEIDKAVICLLTAAGLSGIMALLQPLHAADPPPVHDLKAVAAEVKPLPPRKPPVKSTKPAPGFAINKAAKPVKPRSTTPVLVGRPAMPPQSLTKATNAPSGLRPDEVLFNFQKADIEAVIKTVSQITGRNFLVDPRVKGKITIISSTPVSKAAVYQVFISALKAQGFTAAAGPAGIVRIIPIGEAKQNARVSYRDKPRGEDMVTHTVVVQHGSAALMMTLLRPLMAPTSHLSVYQPANTLIITDYANNMRNLLYIVNELDQQGSSEITIVPLNHASALDIAEVLVRLYPNVATPVGVARAAKAGTGIADRVTILPDLRTNSLLIRTENRAIITQLQELIDRLDVPAKIGGNTRVVYLRNADATKLAEILRGLLAGEARASRTPTAARAAGTARAATGAGGGGAAASLIQADEATNSLIINAPDAVYNNLRAVIEKLDIRRAQVFVEALIIEITTEKASEFGFQWFAGNDSGSGVVGGVVNFPGRPGIIGTALDPTGLAAAGGLSIAYVGEEIVLNDGRVIRSVGALARALEESNTANILSTPNILTLDNTEAKIVVGQNVPFLTGSFTSTGGSDSSVNPFQTIERKDVGLTLRIKPQISEGGAVKLEIFQETSSISVATLAAQDLITNTRTLETTVVVEDGHTIVLGGLIEDNKNDNVSGVPFLSKIPILGYLFKYREKRNTKTNLMIFLRPVIVRVPEDSFGFTENRYE